MTRPSKMRQLALWSGIVAVFAIAGTILFRTPSIDLGWRTPRGASEYRRNIRAAMHSATVTGAIHSIDVDRGIMRIDASMWENQDERMRQSLIRLSSRYFKLEGRSPAVVVMNAFSNRVLAQYDGAGQFTMFDLNGQQTAQLPDDDATLR